MNAIAKNALFFAAAAGAALAVTAVIAVSTAQAAEPSKVSTINAPVGDFGASTKAGAMHVHFRLQSPAETVCGEDAGMRPQPGLIHGLQNCEQQAIEPAVARIHTALLTTIFLRHFPERRGTVQIEAQVSG
jgi:UrcA family protein